MNKSLAEIRRELQTMRAQLVQRADQIEDDYARGRDRDSKEQAVEVENDDTLAEIDRLAGVEVAQIDKAISRIDAGRYSQCESCGQPIEAGRLLAVPFASTCIECAGSPRHAH